MTMPAQDTAAPVEPGQGVETTQESSPETSVESTPDVQPDEPQAQPDGGQGLIAAYLEGVDEPHRDVVADALNKYRADTDARVTKKFEQLNAYQQYAPDPQQLETPVALYENLLDRPLDTVKWIFDQFSEAGIDLRAELLKESQEPTEAPQPQTDPTDDPDRPLTYAEFQKLEQQRVTQAQEQQAQEHRRVTVEGWFNEATASKGLELSNEDVAVKQAILTHAAQLLPKLSKYGNEAGKVAIETATEAFVNRFGKPAASKQDPPPEPRLADGGTPPAPPAPDLSDAKTRKAWMLAQLTGANTQE